jgi:4-hydroxy-3-methylbut-2-enyl diphosphate reductase IspH
VEKVGVTAGASTPNWLIDQVVEKLRHLADNSI